MVGKKIDAEIEFAAFKTVFSSENGKIVEAKIRDYRDVLVNKAMELTDTNQQVVAINQAAGVDGILQLIQQEMFMAEQVKRDKEGSDRE